MPLFCTTLFIAFRFTPLKTHKALEQAIEQEKNIKFSSIPTASFYEKPSSSQALTLKEQEEWCNQSFFICDDSCRTFLDSLFQIELTKLNLVIPAAIHCRKGDYSHFSCIDSSFYKNATALTPIIYRRKENTNDFITIQAYVEIPFGLLLKQTGMRILFIGLITIALSFLIHFLIEFQNKKNKIIIPEKEKETTDHTPTIEKPVVALVRTFGKKGKLPHNLYFNKRNGLLKWENEDIFLSERNLKLFILLLESRKSVVSYDEIYIKINNTEPLKKNSTSKKEVVSNAISRLRKDLSKFPFIQIQSLRNLGYQLIINEPIDNFNPNYPSEV